MTGLIRFFALTVWVAPFLLMCSLLVAVAEVIALTFGRTSSAIASVSQRQQ